VKTGERVNGKGHKELRGRAMDCSTAEGGKVKKVTIG
jgi:hypothetical protein